MTAGFFFEGESYNSGTTKSRTATNKEHTGKGTLWECEHVLQCKVSTTTSDIFCKDVTLKRRKAVIQQVLPCSSSAHSILNSFDSPRHLLGFQWKDSQQKSSIIYYNQHRHVNCFNKRFAFLQHLKYKTYKKLNKNPVNTATNQKTHANPLVTDCCQSFSQLKTSHFCRLRLTLMQNS